MKGDQLVAGAGDACPAKLTPEQQELLKQFAESAGWPY